MDQEPKYEFRDGRVISRSSGEAIPPDEPVFVFRARDVHALDALHRYADVLVMDERTTDDHLEAVQQRILQFARFADNHPDRMKTPDT